MTKESKTNIKRVFGSLVNNGTAIDGAKFSPWWIAVILFILGLILPVLPLFVSAAKSQGTSFMDSYEYGLGLDKTFGVAMNDLDGALTFDNTNKTISYQANSQYCTTDETLIGGYIATAGECKDQYELRIFYSTITDAEEQNAFIKAKELTKYTKGTTTTTAEDENCYTPTNLFFFKNGFYMDIFASNTATIKSGMSFISDLNCFDYSKGDLKQYFVGETFNKDNKDNRIDAVNNLKTFIDDTYATAKSKNMWLNSLLYIGVFAVMNIFMTLMIFLMSRGKNNPNNYLTFWTCMKINWWECFCPGLLGMILGFIFSGAAVTIYVMLLAVRTMWLTMKELRPY